MEVDQLLFNRVHYRFISIFMEIGEEYMVEGRNEMVDYIISKFESKFWA